MRLPWGHSGGRRGGDAGLDGIVQEKREADSGGGDPDEASEGQNPQMSRLHFWQSWNAMPVP